MKTRFFSALAIAAIGMIALNGCSKKDSPKPDKNTAKIFKAVITRDDAFETSDPILNFNISGVDEDGIPMMYAADYSKPDDPNISLSEDDVIAHKKITIKSLRPVVTTQIAFGCSADKVTTPTHVNIVFYYDDKKIDEKLINVTSEDYVKVWTFDPQ